MNSFHTRLDKLCIESGRKMQDIAKSLFLSPNTLYCYRNGNHVPGIQTLCRMADFFGVTTDYLLGRSDKK